MIDLHIHSSYSQDSKEPAENFIKEAINKGGSIIGFSEHLDYDYIAAKIDLPMTDVDAYYKNALNLKEKYKGKITILAGAEFAYNDEAQPLYLDVEKKYNFDYVINSVHIVDGLDPYFGKYFDGKTKKQAYTRYLETILESILNAKYDYQIIGHIGYVSRYGPYEDKVLHYTEFKSQIDGILKAIIEKQKTLEINTHVKDLNHLHFPKPEILKRYYELGGRNISFGSDAHQKERVFDKFDLVKNFLLDVGFKELSYFINKKQYTKAL